MVVGMTKWNNAKSLIESVKAVGKKLMQSKPMGL
jgi:hypothetical protein